MSHRHIRDEGKTKASNKNLPVVSKCLAIVLIPKTRKSSGDVLDNDEADETIIDATDGNVIQSKEVHKALSPNGYSGKELLHDFKIRNKTCYWNPSLVESIKSLEYKGFVEPSTILVTSSDIHLENLRSAWGRRVLKAPAGFTIERIGDVNGIQMQVIPQTQFMPLPDALCSIIMDLNMQRIVATLDVILEKLSLWYKDMTVPSQQLVFDTLGSLIKERKVFHTGSGYFVVTPDTNRLQTSTNSSYLPSNASWLPYHPMYVPVFQGQYAQQPDMLAAASRAHMRSISCQVTTIEESSDEESSKEKDKEGTLGKSGRSNTLPRNKVGKEDKKSQKNPKGNNKAVTEEGGEFKRSSSLKYKGEKSKAAKDVNLKSSNINQEKEKGEKTSILSKIFGRKKKLKDKALMPPPPPPPPAMQPVAPSTVSNSTEGKEPKEKEYATFSAQFPPPEWMWYQQQLEKQKRTETWVTQQTTKSTTVQQSSKVTTRPPTGSSTVNQGANDYRYQSRKSLVGAVDYLPMSAVGSQRNKRIIDNDKIREEFNGEFAKPRSIRPDNLYESFRNATNVKSRHRKSRDFDRLEKNGKLRQGPSEYDVIDQGDVTPFQDSNVYHSVSALSPVAHLSDESTYAKLIEQPKLGPLHSTPRCEGQHDRTAYGIEGHEARDRIYGPPHQKRKSHRARRRAQRMYSYYGQGDDISYEYKGRLPNKNSSHAQSRDSGVNCVGLGMKEGETKRQSGPVYENTPDLNKHHHQHHQNKILNHQHQPPKNHVHFDVNSTENESTADLNPHYVTDPATNSVVYQSDVTNTAYNSVVYGSSVTDNVGGPSVIYHTLEGSELPMPCNSLQSAFYDDSSMALPASKVITLKAEINPKAPQEEVGDLQGSPGSMVDVEGESSPRAREVLGSSDGVVELAEATEAVEYSGGEDEITTMDYGGRENRAGAVGGADDDDDDDDSEEEDYSDHDNIGSEKENRLNEPPQNNAQNSAVGELNVVSSLRRQELVNGHAGKDHFVSDSGFSSPRNPEGAADKKAQNCGQSQSSSEQSDTHTNHENSSDPQGQHQDSSGNHHQHSTDDANGSDGHHTNSDVNMATGSEHHSGSTNENGDLSNGTISLPERPQSNNVQKLPQNQIQRPPLKVPQSHSCNSFRSHNHKQHQPQQPQMQLSQQHHHQNFSHQYQPAAKVVPHPDVYNNNTANPMYIEPARSVRIPLHPNVMLNNHRSQPGKSKRNERPRSVDLLKSNDLHRFEEEQLSKKYGTNGEFEVMGVL